MLIQRPPNCPSHPFVLRYRSTAESVSSLTSLCLIPQHERGGLPQTRMCRRSSITRRTAKASAFTSSTEIHR